MAPFPRAAEWRAVTVPRLDFPLAALSAGLVSRFAATTTALAPLSTVTPPPFPDDTVKALEDAKRMGITPRRIGKGHTLAELVRLVRSLRARAKQDASLRPLLALYHQAVRMRFHSDIRELTGHVREAASIDRTPRRILLPLSPRAPAGACLA